MPEEHKKQLQQIEHLFKRFYKPLKTYAFRFVNDKDIAEDVVQDVFFELWSRREYIRFENQPEVKSYLFKSVYNRSLNIINAGLLEKKTLDDTAEELLLKNYHFSHIQNQEHSLLLKELEDEIALFIETLPPQCKKVFVLSRIQELKNKEIAEQLGISIKAVEKHITKALALLKEHLMKKDMLFILFLFSKYFI